MLRSVRVYLSPLKLLVTLVNHSCPHASRSWRDGETHEGTESRLSRWPEYMTLTC